MKQRLQDIQDRIKKACDFAGRDPSDITLIAVTKNRLMEHIKPLMDHGITHFGENRVQEAVDKWLGFNTDALTLHMIGPLQSNKVKQASEVFDVLHTLDRPSLLSAITKADWRPQTFIQVNTGAEPQKSGILSHDLGAFLDQRHAYSCHSGEDQNPSKNKEGSRIKPAMTDHLCQGLMCIPPIDEPASLHFSLLSNLAKANNMHHLSMGMSEDFEAAITCGATHIRLGRILFDDL